MKSVKYIIGSSLLIAGMIFSLTTPRMTTAQEGGQAAVPPRIGAITPGIEPDHNANFAPKLLYFAPSEHRNIAMDEGIIKLRHDGVEVTYVTHPDQFIDSLYGSIWDGVIVVDIPDELLVNETLSEYVLRFRGQFGQDMLVYRTECTGESSTRLLSNISIVESDIFDPGIFSIPCFIDLLDCNFGILFTGGCLHAQDPRACRRCCNVCARLCESGVDCGVDCTKAISKSPPTETTPGQ